MRIGRRVVKALFWGIVLCLSILAGGLWFAYWYMTDGTITQLIREAAVRYFPGSTLDPGKVHLSLYGGKADFREVRLIQQIDGTRFEVLRIPYLKIRINTRKLAKGHLEAHEVVASLPTLRLRHRRDGTWNLDGLLANPWPGPWIETPPIKIENATLELIPDNDEPPSSAVPPQASSNMSQIAGARVISVAGARAEAAGSSLSSPLRATAPAGGVANRNPAILRGVSLKIEGAGENAELLKFEGTAQGDVFEKIRLAGTIDLLKGSITLEGDLKGLTLSETLRRRIPVEARPAIKKLALDNGVVDIALDRFCYDPSAVPGSRLRYQAQAWLREGVWACPSLPFSVTELSALLGLKDGILTVQDARGSNGPTSLRAEGTIGIGDPRRVALNLHVKLTDLELDQRLRDHTPIEYNELWDVFKPRGTVDAAVHLVRHQPDEPVDISATVFCRDVAAVYRHFPYPLDHLTGPLTLERKLLTVDVHTLQGGQPLRLKGTIQNPGVDAVVKLDIQAESILIDDALKRAMPPKVRKVVDQFNPSGVVKAHANVFRKPLPGRLDRPEGEIKIDAEIDLAERCEITWARLPYPVRNLKGRLEIHPDSWVFRNVRGSNGEAKLIASGTVKKLLHMPKLANGEDPLNIEVDLSARNLPFSGELREALPPEWKMSWPTVNPSGSCDVEANVRVAPGHKHTHIVIVPNPESNVRLEVTRAPQPGLDPGGTIELPMNDVHGRFVFDDGRVAMNDVTFKFRGEPVKFSRGKVVLEDTGRFELAVNDLWVNGLRFDADLRKKMPPLMSQFALRLDGQTVRARGDLMIGWTGKAGEPAWCRWKDTVVVFDNNRVETGIPLEHIQGELNRVKGWSNGAALEVDGILQLGSVSLLGQQITDVESPFQVKQGVATLENVKGHFLKGDLLGEDCSVTLDTTPHYHAKLAIHGAQLQEYARTISGRQSYRGNIAGRIELSGWGNDVRNLRGAGEAHITEGELGELSPVARVATALAGFSSIFSILFSPADRPRPAGKTAFDSADVAFWIEHGVTTFDPIKFTGNAFSLQGQGTMSPQGNLELGLNVLLGRDRFHIRFLSDVAREASTPILIVKVTGTPSYPIFDIKALPLFNELYNALVRGKKERQ